MELSPPEHLLSGTEELKVGSEERGYAIKVFFRDGLRRLPEYRHDLVLRLFADCHE